MAEAAAGPAAPEIVEWLAAIRPDLVEFAAVFVEDGARSAQDLRAYEEEDWPVLSSKLEAAGCARLPRKFIREKLLVRPQTPAVSGGPRPDSGCTSSSGLGSSAMPYMDDDDDGKDREWVPLSSVSSVSRAQAAATRGVTAGQKGKQQAESRHELRPESAQLGNKGINARVGSRASQASPAAMLSGTGHCVSALSMTSTLVVPVPVPAAEGPSELADASAPGCPKCQMLLTKALAVAESTAKRSAAEVKAMGPGKHSRYNFTRLKTILYANCFTPLGGWAVHCGCAMAIFKVSGAPLLC